MESVNRKSSFVMIILLTATISLVLFPSPLVAMQQTSAELIKLKTRDEVTQQFVLMMPEQPVAAIILFSGGKGRLRTSSIFGKPKIENAKNFLIRSRGLFVSHGFMVAVIDVPSDRWKEGMFDAWRLRAEHVQDVEAVVGYLSTKKNLPVFLVGTSMGSISVANCGSKIKSGITGLVLCSSVTKSRDTWDIYDNYPNGILDLQLESINIPVMVVAHKGDKCFPTPPENANILRDALINSPNVFVKIFSGGKKPEEEGCSFWSEHSYYGIEESVVSEISSFIKGIQ